MLSPVEIQNKEFKKAKVGGYNMNEVNDFLDEILESYQELTKENFDLKDKISMLNENLQYYRSMEATIQNALVLAEKTAQDTKAYSYQQSEQIKQEAEIRAEQIVGKAREEVYGMRQKIEELKRQYINYKVQIKQMLNAQLQLVESQVLTNLADEKEEICETPSMSSNMSELEKEEREFFTKQYSFKGDETSA